MAANQQRERQPSGATRACQARTNDHGADALNESCRDVKVRPTAARAAVQSVAEVSTACDLRNPIAVLSARPRGK
jgi:hypothetical protein